MASKYPLVFALASVLILVSSAGISAANEPAAVPSVSISFPATNRTIHDQYYDMTIPWIQTGTSLTVTGTADNIPSGGQLELVVDQGTVYEVKQWSTSASFVEVFPALRKAEHTIDAYIVDASLHRLTNPEAHAHLDHIAIGEILVVLGDSTSAGAGGHTAPPPVWNCQMAQWHTADCRTFEQADGYVSSTGVLGTGTSFHVDLASRLASSWGFPVFVMNEAWSTSDTYHFLNTILPQAQFQNRIRDLKPTRWLINYGVNDYRAEIYCHLSQCGDASLTPESYLSRLQAIVDNLNLDLGVTPDQIYLAEKFSYDMESDTEYVYEPMWRTELPKYFSAIRDIQSGYPSVKFGPNLWDKFRDNNAWCGAQLANSWIADFIHPSVLGYQMISNFWAETLTVQNTTPGSDGASKTFLPFTGRHAAALCPASGPGPSSSYSQLYPGAWGQDSNYVRLR